MKTVHEYFDRLSTSFSRILEWMAQYSRIRGSIRGRLSAERFGLESTNYP
jgi:hypothetical protein